MSGTETLSYHILKQNSQQAEKLFQLIENSLQEAKLKLTDIDLVSITNGPGSFTGVRIALASALGLQLACTCDFIALSNFQVLAWQAREFYPNRDIAVILDARREQLYLQLFDSDLRILSEPQLLTITEITSYLPNNAVLIGDGVKYLSQTIDKNLDIIANAQMLVQASGYYWQQKLYYDLIPLYIREPDASLPKNRAVKLM